MGQTSGAAGSLRDREQPGILQGASQRGISLAGLCPHCQRIGRPSCHECLASKAPRRAQEVSGNEQATETSRSDACVPVAACGTGSGTGASVDNRASAVPEVDAAPAGIQKPNVNAALGRGSSGAFRESHKCQNSRCARLKMPLCEPCRVLNKGM